VLVLGGTGKTGRRVVERLTERGRDSGRAHTLGLFAERAVDRGVPWLVLLSGRGEEEAERAERAVRDSGAQLTVLRSTWFAQNFSEDYWREQVQGSELALPAGNTPEPFVDADDIAIWDPRATRAADVIRIQTPTNSPTRA